LVRSVNDAIQAFLTQMNDRNKERNAKTAALKTRVTELEGQAAPGSTDAALVARVKALEERPPTMAYKGVFAAGQTYERGEVVTWGGSMWHANTRTTEKPGEASMASRSWTLCCKKGSDGKDAKDRR
jgi:hypothetical protein